MLDVRNYNKADQNSMLGFGIDALNLGQDILTTFMAKTRGPGELIIGLSFAMAGCTDPEMSSSGKAVTKEELVIAVSTVYDLVHKHAKEHRDAN